VHVHRDPPPIVGDGNGTVDVYSHFDPTAVTCQMFVDGVIQDLEHAVVETSFIRVSYIHSGTLANRIKAFELVDLCGIILLFNSNLGFGFLRLVRRVRHSATKGSKIQPPDTRNFVKNQWLF
jgi:hypothetical protein